VTKGVRKATSPCLELDVLSQTRKKKGRIGTRSWTRLPGDGSPQGILAAKMMKISDDLSHCKTKAIIYVLAMMVYLNLTKATLKGAHQRKEDGPLFRVSTRGKDRNAWLDLIVIYHCRPLRASQREGDPPHCTISARPQN